MKTDKTKHTHEEEGEEWANTRLSVYVSCRCLVGGGDLPSLKTRQTVVGATVLFFFLFVRVALLCISSLSLLLLLLLL